MGFLFCNYKKYRFLIKNYLFLYALCYTYLCKELKALTEGREDLDD